MASAGPYADEVSLYGLSPGYPTADCRLMLQLHLDDAGAHSRLQRRVVLFGLVGVGERKFAHRLVELGALLPEIPADRPRVTGLGMRTRQHLTAHLAVDRQHLYVEGALST